MTILSDMTPQQRQNAILTIALQVSAGTGGDIGDLVRDYKFDGMSPTPAELSGLQEAAEKVLDSAAVSPSTVGGDHAANTPIPRPPLRIIEFDMKHYTRRFAVRTKEDMSRVAYRMLKEWWESGYLFQSEEQTEADFEATKKRILATARMDESVLSLDSLPDELGLPSIIVHDLRDRIAAVRDNINDLERWKDADVAMVRHVSKLVVATEDEAIKMTVSLRGGRTANAATYCLNIVSSRQYMGYNTEDVEEVSEQ